MNQLYAIMLNDVTMAATQKLAASNQSALDRSIFVTGLSGAGKTTLVNRLVGKFKLPLEQTDRDPGIRAMMLRTSDMEGMHNLVKDSTEYRAKLKPHVQKFLGKIKKPSLIEGSFLMEFPELIPKDARKILVDTSLGVATKRRISREIEKALNKGKIVDGSFKKRLRDFSNVLGQYYKPFYDSFRKRPDVELRKS